MLSTAFFRRFSLNKKQEPFTLRTFYLVALCAAMAIILSGETHKAKAQEQQQGIIELLPDDQQIEDMGEPEMAPSGMQEDELVIEPVAQQQEGEIFVEPTISVQQVEGDVLAPNAEMLSGSGEITGVIEVSADPPPSADLPPVTPADAGQSAEIPSVSATPDIDENVFFDADSLVPTGEMGNAAPRKVNPVLQPGSRLIVVKKESGKGGKKAQIVAATRAMKLGRYDAALDMYDQLYQKNKRDPRILMGRAVSLQHLGRFEAAIGAYEELSNIDPDNIEAKINMLGLMGTKYPSVALRRLLDLRDDMPNNAGIAAQIAVAQAQLGQYQEAMRYLGIASSIEPKNAGHIYNMAIIADRAGAKKEAIKYYEQALELDSIYGRGQTIPRESVYERLANIR